MKNKNLLVSLLVLFVVFIFSSCSNDDTGITSPVSTTDAPDMTENGSNPDETALTSETDHHGTGYIYT